MTDRETTPHGDSGDIAIVGMALRVPGARTPEAFWDNLVTGREAREVYLEEQLLARGEHARALASPHYVRSGMPLEGFDEFDAEFFGFSPKEAAILDPQHRQFYEVAWEALERAGHAPRRFDGSIGVFAGCGMNAYFAFNLLSNAPLVDSVGLFLLRHTGNDKDFLSTRVSYAFNLRGPSISVQTACSTSLVATHLAVQSLLARECDLALAGGVTIEIPHGLGYEYKDGEILSPDGHCRAFDRDARGTVFGSGACVVVLRRLAEALAAGDHIHAVIRGSAVNNDGAGKVGYLAPSVDGQAAAVAEALGVAGIGADTLGYVECHGTGTPVGDPIEIAALTSAFRQTTSRRQYCAIGSVKTNIGHLDTAAGAASLIKATLAVEHGLIPPSLHFQAPNPALNLESSPFHVARDARPWAPSPGPRRAGVNSLGVGGTNAFVVLEQAPSQAASASAAPQPLIVSARDRRALEASCARLATHLRQARSSTLADIAFTLHERERFVHRRVLAARDPLEAAVLLEGVDARRVQTFVAEADPSSVVFMYPGGGAQYPRMARGLYELEPVFREHMDRGLARLRNQHGVDLEADWIAAASSDRDGASLARPAVQLPLLFLVEYALTQLWFHYGVRPSAVIGHSLGENTAACVAGVMSFEDALGLVLLRGQLMSELPTGAMLSVSLAGPRLAEWLGAELDLAAENAPALAVASGPAAAIDTLATRLGAQGIDAQRVRIDIAAHSRMLAPVLARFRTYLENIELHEPLIPIVSNVTGAWLDPARARDPGYWVDHLRSTVRFSRGVEFLLRGGSPAFVEVGPGHTLASLVRQHGTASSPRIVASMRRVDDDVPDDLAFRAALGRLLALGAAVDIQRLWPTPRRRVPLPTYPFQRTRFWIDPGAGASGGAEALHPRRLAEGDDWFTTTRWVQQGLLECAETPRRVLLFGGTHPSTEMLVSRMRAAGREVVVVRAGDTYARIAQHEFTLAPEAGGVGYEELVDELLRGDLRPDRIVHGWLLTTDESFRPGSSFFHRNQEFGFYSLAYLAQALGRAGFDGRCHVLVLTNGMLRVGTEPLPYPEKATALGVAGVLPREFPHLTCSVLDVAPDASDSVSLAAALDAELLGEPDDGVAALREDVRWRRHVGRWRESTGRGRVRLKDRGTYLVTGGFGGIGRIVAEWLARTYRARLVLLGRTPLPARSDWDTWLAEHGSDDRHSSAIRHVRRLESLGAAVLPLAADVAVADQLRDALRVARDTYGPLSGVFHAAGVVRDNLLQLKTQRDIEDVFAPKVYGTVALDEAVADDPLDFFVLFSSASTIAAPAGQADYVGANAFLNAWADAQHGRRAYPVVAVNWGIWRGIGMVGDSGGSDRATLEALPGTATFAMHRPHFDQRRTLREGVDTVHWLEGTLADSDWLVAEHRLATGESLLPGTGYLELARSAVAEVSGTEALRFTGFSFARPLFVARNERRPFRVRLRGGEAGWECTFLAQDGTDWVEHATARASPVTPSPPDLPLRAIDARCRHRRLRAPEGDALRTRQEDHLRFGPRWRVLREAAFGDGEAVACLALPDDFAGDCAQYRMHPALLDIATGFAMDLIPGYADQDPPQHLWAPIGYRSVTYYGALTREIASWARLSGPGSTAEGYAAFDVTVADPHGHVLVEVEQLTLRRVDAPLRDTRSRLAMPTEAGIASTGPGQRTAARSPGERALQHNVTQGITPEEGVRALERVLGAAVLPANLIVSSMSMQSLREQAGAVAREAVAGGVTRFARPALSTDFEAPRDDVERELATIWGSLLGVDGVGIRDNFFDLGGHSLTAVRFFNELSNRYGVDLPLSALVQAPTIAGLADLVRGQPGAGESVSRVPTKFTHLVPMHRGAVGDRTPFFVVAGMFGNVLNLSHLAHLLGEERAFYALQARGLYGDAPPHETFEDMARDYIEEMRKVQPRGPYLVGGFSGGGITAFEMAKQLIAAGDEVLRLVLLDTPLRENTRFSLADKLSMFRQGLERGGLGFIRSRVRDRIAWERHKRAERYRLAHPETVDPVKFQSRLVGDAFLRAVARYRARRVEVDVALFRPRLDVRYRLPAGRMVDGEKNFIATDNFWTPYVRSIEIFEVPGSHDSMVLEPNVRVLVSALRRSIRDAESAIAH